MLLRVMPSDRRHMILPQISVYLRNFEDVNGHLSLFPLHICWLAGHACFD